MSARKYPSGWYKNETELLVRIRQSAGLTQEQLASELDRHQSFVAKLESGERILQFLDLVAICSACGTTPSEVLQDFDPDHPAG